MEDEAEEELEGGLGVESWGWSEEGRARLEQNDRALKLYTDESPLISLKMRTQYHHHTAIASNIIETWYFLTIALGTYEPNKQKPTNKTKKAKEPNCPTLRRPYKLQFSIAYGFWLCTSREGGWTGLVYSTRFYSGFLQLLIKCESLPPKKRWGEFARIRGHECVCVCVQRRARRDDEKNNEKAPISPKPTTSIPPFPFPSKNPLITCSHTISTLRPLPSPPLLSSLFPHPHTQVKPFSRAQPSRMYIPSPHHKLPASDHE